MLLQITSEQFATSAQKKTTCWHVHQSYNNSCIYAKLYALASHTGKLYVICMQFFVGGDIWDYFGSFICWLPNQITRIKLLQTQQHFVQWFFIKYYIWPHIAMPMTQWKWHTQSDNLGNIPITQSDNLANIPNHLTHLSSPIHHHSGVPPFAGQPALHSHASTVRAAAQTPHCRRSRPLRMTRTMTAIGGCTHRRWRCAVAQTAGVAAVSSSSHSPNRRATPPLMTELCSG